MKKDYLPKRQGLYDPQNEHDSCGIGFIANVKGIKSRDLIKSSLKMLTNLEHRGGVSAEPNTGDGAGILLQIPHKYFKNESKYFGFELPKEGDYGVGMLFLPTDKKEREFVEIAIKRIIREEGQGLLGWRTVPIEKNTIGNTAKASMPSIRQVFISKSSDVKKGEDFERKLYIIRKRIEKYITDEEQYIYFCSLSSRTIVYKGMLTAKQLSEFFNELNSSILESAIALVHSRYSTNTFPSWEKAHPHRHIVHNGEINTIRGNANWMNARQYGLKSEVFGEELSKTMPLIPENGSDSAMFDNCLEFLTHSGRSMPHVMMMMIPEPWSKHKTMSDERKAFYEYHSCLMEPWDGPASVAFTDGVSVGAVLDRNGLRPSRYYVTKNDLVIMSSEVGAVEIHEEDIVLKQRLSPGKMLLVDTEEGRIIEDDEIKDKFAAEHPYRDWLNKYMYTLRDLPLSEMPKYCEEESLVTRQKAFGYSYEELKIVIEPMAAEGMEPIGSMGSDMPLAVLSKQPQSLFNYFKQLFAQVTNPPIDSIREELVVATEMMMGTEGDFLKTLPDNCRQIKINECIINNKNMAKLKEINNKYFKSTNISTLFDITLEKNPMENALEKIFEKADEAISNGCNIIVLSDRGINKKYAPIPVLLVAAGVHHHLIRKGTRLGLSIVIESGEPREVHHFALLLGYGVATVNPYLAFETIDSLIKDKTITGITYDKAVSNFIKASVKGIVKILSKMGISTIQSYHGAQIFEAIGISNSVISKYFTKTQSRIEGLDIDDILEEVKLRHIPVFERNLDENNGLDSTGEYKWRKDGEKHLYNPESIYLLQKACRTNDYKSFKEFSKLIEGEKLKNCNLRGIMDFESPNEPIPIEEVESAEKIVKRFKTGAMSYGSISKEAHEAIAIAMNRIGGKSNTGEGGEDSERFVKDANGDSRSSAIKQVASGRFGVSSNYLVNANEIQIKMAQGAKPGEGGQLPGKKVYPWIADVRNSTAGVGLISPPPHHDIYSIEDLSQLIFDLKNANREARISVKLVSEVGVGTIAAGVAKGKADVILISGYDGGTGAAPRSSIRHAGLPWELGLAETHQTLLLNDLRSRVVVETDGKILTGRDIVFATLLGAEEYGFATAPLVALGCVMMRVCHLNTCPVGIATQNPELRKNFKGDPSHVENFMYFIAKEVREIMAELGFRTINELIGRADLLKMSSKTENIKTKNLDLSTVFYTPSVPNEYGRYCKQAQEHDLDRTLDNSVLLKICEPALKEKKKIIASTKILNTDRAVGTILGSEVSKIYGEDGLPEDTITLEFTGSAGQSFGAFVPKGITMLLEGDSNDYVGKGLSGGKIMIYPSKKSNLVPDKNILIGNVAFYGGIEGEAYISGIAGERFCVRNSGINAVVEGVGDHGCEYMTGGKVVVIGGTGRNFAAGMSGGVAYVLDETGNFSANCNDEMVYLKKLEVNDEIIDLKNMLQKHYNYTGSMKAKKILDDFDNYKAKFVKVMPKDYEKMIESILVAKNKGLKGNDAIMSAFLENNRD